MIAAVSIAFLIGAVAGCIVGVLVGAVVADTLAVQRRRRRRELIDIDGADALESWLAGVEWPYPQRRTNGSPFHDDAEPVT